MLEWGWKRGTLMHSEEICYEVWLPPYALPPRLVYWLLCVLLLPWDPASSHVMALAFLCLALAGNYSGAALDSNSPWASSDRFGLISWCCFVLILWFYVVIALEFQYYTSQITRQVVNFKTFFHSNFCQQSLSFCGLCSLLCPLTQCNHFISSLTRPGQLSSADTIHNCSYFYPLYHYHSFGTCTCKLRCGQLRRNSY